MDWYDHVAITTVKCASLLVLERQKWPIGWGQLNTFICTNFLFSRIRSGSAMDHSTIWEWVPAQHKLCLSCTQHKLFLSCTQHKLCHLCTQQSAYTLVHSTVCLHSCTQHKMSYSWLPPTGPHCSTWQHLTLHPTPQWPHQINCVKLNTLYNTGWVFHVAAALDAWSILHKQGGGTTVVPSPWWPNIVERSLPELSLSRSQWWCSCHTLHRQAGSQQYYGDATSTTGTCCNRADHSKTNLVIQHDT